MNRQEHDENPHPLDALLPTLDTLAVADAALLIQARGLAVDAPVLLAQATLAHAEQAPQRATHWLAVARALDSESDHAGAWIAYAQARLHATRGELGEAERHIRIAQGLWRSANDPVAWARSQLGVTQILAMQGRFEEAATAIDQAIAQFAQIADPDPALKLQIAVAHRNRSSLFSVQDRHEAALHALDVAFAMLDQIRRDGSQGSDEALETERAHLYLNQAVSLMHLDRIDSAEAALQQAVVGFDRLGDQLNRGRARTNLGALFALTGRFADALTHFAAATADLMPDDPVEEALGAATEQDAARAYQAAILLLDQAATYIALNLRPEAARGLARCETLFRRAGQPYELGQSLYMQGLLAIGDHDLDRAEAALSQAALQFEALDNGFWRNRVQLAQAQLAYRRGARGAAANAVDALLARSGTDLGVNSRVECLLLRLHLAVDAGAWDAARAADAAIDVILADLGDATAMPHLRWRALYAKGVIARATDDLSAARDHFFAAVDLIEAQRISLTFEEARTAYVDDKADAYSALITLLLDAQPLDEDAIAEAFAVMERSRARALLERLLAATATDSSAAARAPDDAERETRRNELRRRLHWLYNQLLGEEGERQPRASTGRAIAEYESVLKRLEWSQSPLTAQAEPVTLRALQQTLAENELAIVYFTTTNEVMAFLVGHRSAEVVRNLCTDQELAAALNGWRFQLGRVEIGHDYAARHGRRLLLGAQAALARLYALLIAPIAAKLQVTRLRFIPHGQLHHAPFHALFDGERYLLERWHTSVVPSASIAALCHTRQSERAAYASLAAFAVPDPGLPHTEVEARTAAAHFAHSRLYVGRNATMAALSDAANWADILHIATHGMLRSDNAYFSALKLADGWCDVRTLYRLPLRTRLVVLSACESGAGQVRGGDDLVGLARGFIGAGAPALIVTLWNVHDESAAGLMADFYAGLGAEPGAVEARVDGRPDPAAALRYAQMAAIDRGRHPYFWASFYAIG